MSKYIDADALIEAMGEEPYVWTDSAEEIAERNQWLTDMGIIESAPSIDIVRCAECKYKQQCHKAVEHTTYKPTSVTIAYSSIDFCSYGERREP